jgi:heterodisulfide reductase subunit B
MCQLNLEAYQKPISQAQGEDVSISILYLPQLMGVAFGLPKKDLKLNLNLALTKSLKEKLGI